MLRRASGILLHITSLPSRYGIGDLGPQAYKFADFLADAKQSYWQILPLNPPSPMGYSPYNCLSAFAGNSLLISPEQLYRDGFLSRADIHTAVNFPADKVDFSKVVPNKNRLLYLAYEDFKKKPKDGSFDKFCEDNKDWLEDYVIFMTLRELYQNRLWSDWPAALRNRSPRAIESVKAQMGDVIERGKFFQYIFFKQHFALKKYCNERDIKIIGDIPIYVSHDSADVWSHPEVFKLTKHCKPRFVAGVPPDHFSKTGQLWGTPVYDWSVLQKTGYMWWLNRIKHNARLFDMMRLDHFRGFVYYWQVRAGDKTAEKGRWVKVPSEDFFARVLKTVSRRKIIVEDLGYITASVQAIIEKFQLAGMRILQFGFCDEPKKNPHYLKSHTANSVVYTGTHDTNTARGWFENEAGKEQKKMLFELIGCKISGRQAAWEMMKLALNSKSTLAVIPMQDILGLGSEARMNVPATTKNNWVWRFSAGQISLRISERLADLAITYGRTSG